MQVELGEGERPVLQGLERALSVVLQHEDEAVCKEACLLLTAFVRERGYKCAGLSEAVVPAMLARLEAASPVGSC